MRATRRARRREPLRSRFSRRAGWPVTSGPDGSVTYAAAYARSQASLRDFELADLKPPSQLRAQAAVEHERGVRLTGLAVLFVAALVLLTFAELGSPVAARLFAVSGAVVALAAAVLFVLV
jgi:hypothetical protein